MKDILSLSLSHSHKHTLPFHIFIYSLLSNIVMIIGREINKKVLEKKCGVFLIIIIIIMIIINWLYI